MIKTLYDIYLENKALLKEDGAKAVEINSLENVFMMNTKLSTTQISAKTQNTV